MIDSASTSQPPLWPSVGALLVSGWAGGLVASMLWAPLLGAARFGAAFGPGTLAAGSLLPTVAGALVAAMLLPRLVRTFCEFELGLGAAFAVTLGRSLASLAVSMLFLATMRSAVAPAPAMFLFVPQILSLVVGYQLLKHLAQPIRRIAPGGLAQTWLEPELAAPEAAAGAWSRLLQSGSRSPSCSRRSSRPSASTSPARSGRRSPGWRPSPTAWKRRRRRPHPAARLSSTSSPRSGPSRAPSSTFAETAWRGDHRRELEHLRGLDEIHRALAQLESAR